MRAAAARLVGEHDFRNLCKMDVDVVSNFVRRIEFFTVDAEDAGDAHMPAAPPPRPGRLMALNVRGTAFLWHQVRCMAALLFMVGRGLEQPSVIDQLLDVRVMPGKPAYDMAPDEPLLLFACGYEHGDGPGRLPATASHTPARTHALLVEHLTAQTRRAELRARVFGHALATALAAGEPQAAPLRHVPLLQRKREATYEQQLARRPPGKVKVKRGITDD